MAGDCVLGVSDAFFDASSGGRGSIEGSALGNWSDEAVLKIASIYVMEVLCVRLIVGVWEGYYITGRRVDGKLKMAGLDLNRQSGSTVESVQGSALTFGGRRGYPGACSNRQRSG